ncbi:MAG: VOC family protein [Candidatus Rokubacteria bacterium]|nr:VOC family protein [Candidatus Rokubacteria bacterium]
MRAFEPLGIDHIVLRVSDQEASQRFYVEVLGCTLAYKLRMKTISCIWPSERSPRWV